jgi:hypothetical protein
MATLAAGLVAAGPAHAVNTLVPRLSGLPWGSGVNGSSSLNAAFTAWRGGRKLDVRTIFFGIRDWGHMAASAGSLSTAINGGSGRLVVALGMLPKSHAGQLAQCAAGQFDPQIRAVVAGMLNNGAQAAANNGRPVVVRLGWEANNEGSYPWAATGDGSSWRNCFRRWVDILNPVGGDGARQKNFLVVWNMANRGTITYPVDNLWPGGQYVDVVGSQYYDRCPPLADGDRYAFEARLDARTHSNNPAGPRAWLEYARSKGKPYAVPEWGIGGSQSVCAEPGKDNPYFVRKMYEFFWDNAAEIAFEAYFNAAGDGGVTGDTHQLFDPGPAFPPPSDPGYLAYVQRFNPNAAAKYRALWSAGAPPEVDEVPQLCLAPPAPPPSSDTLYWLRYVASYGDLIAQLGPDPAAGYASWVATGKAQQRTARFDPQGYMDRQPAIRDLVKGDPVAATKHYITQGYARGIYTWSNGPQHWLRYIASHVELIPTLKTQASAGELHYHHTGKCEGRTVTFDALAYLKANAEARALCGDRDQTCAAKHFINSKL